MNEQILLRAEEIRFAYRSDGVAGFSLELDHLEIRTGEIHALIGPNGCGKSTLLRLMLGLLSPASGTIRFEGRDVRQHSRRELARRIAALPQQLETLVALPVLDVVLMGRHPWRKGLGLADADDLKTAGEAMRRMEVESLRQRSFDTLSGGERQRALIASVLAQQPRVILLDEPTSSLDIHHQAETLNLLRTEAARGVGILVVTHDLTLAGHFADRITLMAAGHKICSGMPGEVLQEGPLRRIYGPELRVVADPESQRPCVLPARRQSIGRAAKGMEQAVGDAGRPASPPGTTPEAGAPVHAGTLTWGRYLGLLSGFALALMVVVSLAPIFGAEKIDMARAIGEMLEKDRMEWSVSAQLLSLRLPRVGMGLLAGMALGCVGAAFQTLLRNPLAEPYTLGIAGASSLGAVIALSFPGLSFVVGPLHGVQGWALGFALGSVALLWVASRRNAWGRSLTGLLLIGVTIGLVSSALIMLVRYLANPLTMRAMDQWLVGGLEVSGWRDVAPCLPFLVPGIVCLVLHARELNQLGFGEEAATARGVEVQRVQRWVLGGGSLATAGVVAAAGPIGFVGLLVPHLVRRLVGQDQRLVLPCSMLAGGAVLVAADTVGRSLSLGGRGAELPVGILTSLIGGPVFIFLLLRGKNHLRAG